MILTGAFMVIYVIAGGMLATTWVQIIKAFLLMAAAVVMTVWVLSKIGCEPDRAVQGRASQSPEGEVPRARPVLTSRSTRSRWGSAWCSAPRACRTS